MFFKVTTKKTLSRCFLVSILLIVILSSGLFLFSNSVRGEKLPKNAHTIEKRVQFVENLGVFVDGTFLEEEKEVEIPYKFSDVYEQYNSLQQKAGYNLKEYCGKKVVHYTLKLSDETRNDVYAHLLVYNGYVIGGDISAIAVDDGYMLPLIKNKE